GPDAATAVVAPDLACVPCGGGAAAHLALRPVAGLTSIHGVAGLTSIDGVAGQPSVAAQSRVQRAPDRASSIGPAKCGRASANTWSGSCHGGMWVSATAPAPAALAVSAA